MRFSGAVLSVEIFHQRLGYLQITVARFVLQRGSHINVIDIFGDTAPDMNDIPADIRLFQLVDLQRQETRLVRVRTHSHR